MFRDRRDAGRRLAQLLRKYRDERPIVLGLPRGGVPVAFEIAQALAAPLDIWIARKIGAPSMPELGVGAVAEGGGLYLNEGLLEELAIDEAQLTRLIAKEQAEVARRVRRFRADRGGPQLARRLVILVDDGIATGATTRAAIAAIRSQGPRQIVLAAGVASPATLADLGAEVDDIVCVQRPQELIAVGKWYEDFTQVTDEEVSELLARAYPRAPQASTETR